MDDDGSAAIDDAFQRPQAPFAKRDTWRVTTVALFVLGPFFGIVGLLLLTPGFGSDEFALILFPVFVVQGALGGLIAVTITIGLTRATRNWRSGYLMDAMCALLGSVLGALTGWFALVFGRYGVPWPVSLIEGALVLALPILAALAASRLVDARRVATSRPQAADAEAHSNN